MPFWETLQIAQTDDRDKIRAAYAKRLKALDIEKDPQSFEELRAAYKEALKSQPPLTDGKTIIIPTPQPVKKAPPVPEQIETKELDPFQQPDAPKAILEGALDTYIHNWPLQKRLLEECELNFSLPLFLAAYKRFHWKRLFPDEIRSIIEERDIAWLIVELEKAEKGGRFTLMMFAALSGDLTFAKLCPPNTLTEQNNDGKSPLHYACLGNHKPLVTYLLKKGADPERVDENGDTPLALALRFNRSRALKALIEGGTKLDWKDKEGKSPLDLAVLHGRSYAVQLIGEKGSKPLNPFALSLAAEVGHLEKVKILIKLGCKVDGEDFPPLLIAARYGFEQVLVYLLKQGADPNIAKDGVSALDYAAVRGLDHIAKHLLKAGALPMGASHAPQLALTWGHRDLFIELIEREDPTKKLIYPGFAHLHDPYFANLDRLSSETPPPLFAACDKGKLNKARSLLDKGDDPNTPFLGLAPLHVAIRGHHHALVDLLIEKGADINDTPDPHQFSPLFIAAQSQNWIACESLLKLGAKDTLTNFFHTALYPAVYHNNIELVEQLIEKGSPLFQVRQEGKMTLVYLATLYGHHEILRLLLTLLPPDWESDQGLFNYQACVNPLTPLAAAVQNRDVEGVALLLEGGADPNRPSFQTPPLHFIRFHPEMANYHKELSKCHTIIEALIRYGADIEGAGPNGDTLLDCAIEEGWEEIAIHLIELGAGKKGQDERLKHAKRRKSNRVVDALIEQGLEGSDG